MHDPGGKLRVATGAAHVHDQIARHSRGHLVAELLPNHVQRQVEARRHARAGKHASVLDENAIGMHRRRRLEAHEIVDVM